MTKTRPCNLVIQSIYIHGDMYYNTNIRRVRKAEAHRAKGSNGMTYDEQKRTYIDQMVLLAQGTNDLTLLDLVCQLMQKSA